MYSIQCVCDIYYIVWRGRREKDNNMEMQKKDKENLKKMEKKEVYKKSKKYILKN